MPSYNWSRAETFLLAVLLVAPIIFIRVITAAALVVLGLALLLVLPGCATDGGLGFTDPATYHYRHVQPSTSGGETVVCEVDARTDRDLPLGLAMDIGTQCEVSLRVGPIDSENISDVIQSVPTGAIPGIVAPAR